MIEIPAVIERCAGIDIGKREVAVAIITGPADEDGAVETRMFGTTVPALETLREWLLQENCTSVAMESTGSYWIPVKNVLEGGAIRIVLVCPKKHKPERGDKTDFRDAMNLAHLHRHGLLKGSFLPRREVVELRDLTRRRKKLLSKSGGGEKPYPEGARDRQRQDWQYRQRYLRRLRPSHGERTSVGKGGDTRTGRGSEQTAAPAAHCRTD